MGKKEFQNKREKSFLRGGEHPSPNKWGWRGFTSKKTAQKKKKASASQDGAVERGGRL